MLIISTGVFVMASGFLIARGKLSRVPAFYGVPVFAGAGKILGAYLALAGVFSIGLGVLLKLFGRFHPLFIAGYIVLVFSLGIITGIRIRRTAPRSTLPR
jgi:protein-S-isoprenylcysteine O-methyltransferase Ste14